jgi:hypothetical protein
MIQAKRTKDTPICISEGLKSSEEAMQDLHMKALLKSMN